jgi:NOL1/NOP2/fmu family ribosome biogenesis protein
MTLHFLNNQEKKEILEKLKNQFGIKEINGVLVRIGQERIFLFQGSFSEEEIKKIESYVPIERVGIYFAKIQNDQIRLSIDGTHLFKDQITKNIFELNEEQTDLWMHGSELNLKTGKNGFLIMKTNNDLLGTGKASAEKITNFIPKSRRLKFKNQ